MKIFITGGLVLVLMVGLVAAAENCGLTIKADKDYQCNDFVEKAKNDPYEVEGVTVDLLKQLNPRLNCDKIPLGTDVCVEGNSKFNDATVQKAATLENFKNAMGKLKLTRSNKFNQQLFDAISDVVIEEKVLRRKRNADGDLTPKEQKMVTLLSNPETMESIKAAILKDDNFKAMEEEFNRGRKAACAQLKEKEGDGKKSKYRMCVCARKVPPPFIQCQALLMQEKVEQNIDTKAATTRTKRAAGKAPPFDFQKYMTKRGCPTMDCLTELCFSTDFKPCAPIATLPGLELCIQGEGCMPNLANLIGGKLALRESQFTDSKLAAKLSVCIMGFNTIMSWLGMEACLAGIQLEYYFFKSQMDASLYMAFVVLKVSAGMKAQLTESFHNGVGFGILVEGETKAMDICTHKDHTCEDYCALETGELAFYVKVEYWWWGWKEAVNKQTSAKKKC